MRAGKKPYSGVTWSREETLSPQEIETLHLDLLKRQLDYVWNNSRHYREKFASAGIAPGDLVRLADLGRFPFTEKDDIRASLAAHPPLGLHLCAEEDAIVQLQASSGTTGKPSYFAYTASDLDMVCETTARCFHAAGFRPGQRILHAFSMSRGFVGGLPMAQTMAYMGLQVLPIGAESGVERILQVMSDLRPSGIIGAPSFIAYLGEKAQEVLGRPASDLGLRHILVGSEPGGGDPATRAHIEGLWGARVREMYGMSDLANSFFAEGDIPDGMHFLGQGHIHAELIDPASGAVLPQEPGVEGELVYTSLTRQAMPLVRFRSRDQVRVLGNDALNGRQSMRIRVMGRTDDMLICRGINLYPGAVQDIINSMKPQTTGRFRIIADFPGHATNKPLNLKVETPLTGDGAGDLVSRLEKTIKELSGVRVRVATVPPGTFDTPGARKPVLIERVVTKA
ncbi:hypothetical protein LL06_25695 [Hoeflea sp. BAL378]|uniref:phenylacetate--CoA ligase family protein n=1 Tax=Hoeflea sp. BAL378 TaxID=1547437 RepID=UPI000513F02C|nr:AMP-binding protein [Hoeflea sp. BAL378]KGF66868.1 hypothetical protein LL06_25695 [Hoeflea sp. BAL378]